VLIYNPFSGAGKGEEKAKKVIKLFSKAYIDVEQIKTTSVGHAEEIVTKLDVSNIDAICVLGGDGTVHEAINGLMNRTDNAKSKIPLGIIPGGTGNAFARELFGHVSDIKISVKHILQGIHCPIDLAEVTFTDNEKLKKMYSFNSIHWGLASRVVLTAEKLRWMGSAARYTTAALFEIVKGDRMRAKITLIMPNEETVVYDERFCLVIANNIRSAAKGMKLAPQAKLNDGLIDVLLVRSGNFLELLELFHAVYEGKYDRTKKEVLEYVQVKGFSIVSVSNGDIVEEVVDIDGELKGKTPFSCVVLPKAVRVLV